MAMPGPRAVGDSDQPGPAWAPFPVQDWDSYRRTASWAEAHPPLAGPPVSLPPVSLPPGPAGRPHRSLPALIVVLVATLLLSGAVAASDRHAPPAEPWWLPADGSAAPVSTAWAPGTGSVENAVDSAASILLSLPPDLGNAAIPVIAKQGSLDAARLLRQTVTPAGANEPQFMAVYSISNGLGLLGQSLLGSEAATFAPAVPLLPDPVPSGGWTGQGTWTASVGDRSAHGSYTAALTAAPADAAGCRAVTGTLTLSESKTTLAATVCPGRGIVGATLPSATFAPAAPGPAAADLAPAPVFSASEPTGRPAARQISFPAGGETVSPNGTVLSFPPALLGDRIVTADRSGADLVLLRHSGATDAEPWLTIIARLHPGGTLMTATVLRGTVLATTSSRRLVAWDADGVRRWSAEVDDPIATPPVELDEHRLVTLSATGTVQARERATGALVWSRRLTPDSYLPPVVAGGQVLVAGPHGLAALDAATGHVRWSDDQSADTAATADGRFFITAGALLMGYDTQGTRLFRIRQQSAQALLAADGALLDAGNNVVSLVDVDGTVRWRRPVACPSPFVAAGWVLCWDQSTGTTLDLRTGAIGSRVTVDTAGVAPMTVGYQGKVVMFANPWKVWTW